MKITWEFNPDEEQDAVKLQAYQQAFGALSALMDIQEHLRQKLKYGDLPDDARLAYEDTRSVLIEVLDVNGVDLDA